jgi:XTP/dITP diphosphohydrolase
VDALGDELGIETRRWGAGESATDDEWLDYFMKEMGARASADEQRGAKFVCNACLIWNENGVEKFEHFEGETLGSIVDEISSEVLPGLPLSSVFLADGFDKVYAALSQEEKNAISHRGQAISKLKKYLTSIYGI